MLNIEIPQIKKDAADTEAAELLQAYADHKISKRDLRALIAEMWRMLSHRMQEMRVMAACRLWLRKNADSHSTKILWDAISELYGEKSPIAPIVVEFVSLSPIKCPNCDAELGLGVELENLLLFKVGALIIRDMKASCANCGHAFYFSVSDRELTKFIRAIVTTPPKPDP